MKSKDGRRYFKDLVYVVECKKPTSRLLGVFFSKDELEEFLDHCPNDENYIFEARQTYLYFLEDVSKSDIQKERKIR